jgi:biopolymer transport protein ExbD
MLNGIKLELPKTKEVNPMQLSSSQIVLSYTKKGQLFLGEKLVDESKVVGQILAGFKSDNQNILYLRADYSMPYGKVAKLMSFLKRGGVSNIALVTEMEERKK